ncbi:MAG TPA: hypothetical protein VJU15_00465 [Gemmatimonadales bacterium]|nr:hypothetical protein [Gemmatimonadales bacterium]
MTSASIRHGSPALESGEFVLYWLQTAMRTAGNHALTFVMEQANRPSARSIRPRLLEARPHYLHTYADVELDLRHTIDPGFDPQ